MTNKMNGNEKIAARNIKGAFNWIVGGYYNCLQDGCEDDIPSLQDVKDEVYDCALANAYSCDCEVEGAAPKEMRFAGEAFCRAYIDKLFTKDSDVQEIWGEDNNTEEDKEMKNTVDTKKEWTRDDARKYMTKQYTLKDLRQMAKEEGIKNVSKANKAELIETLLDLEERKQKSNQGTPKDGTKMNVKMYAFTGMFIGDFEGEVINGELIVTTARKGELRFDLSTGKEITPDFKARYANKIERA